MGFKDQVDKARNERTQHAQANAEVAERERESRQRIARKDAEALLPEVYEAIELLRADQQRSGVSLKGRSTDRGDLGLGAIMAQVRHRDPTRIFFRDTVQDEFAGWWVRREPFEFEIPLEGQPKVGLFETIFSFIGPKSTFDEFVEGAVHEYSRESSTSEDGPSETHEGTAADAFRDFLEQVKAHLLSLH